MDPTANNNNEMNDQTQDSNVDTQALLTAYALGELEGDDLAKAEALIASDPAAKAEVEEIRAVGKQLEEALAAEGAGATTGLKPEQVDAIHAKAEQGSETQEAVVARLVRPWVWWAAGSAAAAMFAVAIMLPALSTDRGFKELDTTSSDVALVEKNHRDRDDMVSTQTRGSSSEIKRQEKGVLGQASAVPGESVSGPLDGAGRTQFGRISKNSGKLHDDREEIGQASSVADSVVAGKPAHAPLPASPPVALAESARSGSRRNMQSSALRAKKDVSALTYQEADRVGGFVPESQHVHPNPNPSFNTEAYDKITDNPFLTVGQNPLSTFSIDVDTASYANVRRMLMQQSQLPPAGAVRIEEMVNYFPYNYSNPKSDDRPFAVHVETGSAPWAHEHRLVKIGIKGKDMVAENKPVTNIVFLIDVSGSMMSHNKMPLLKEGMKLLVNTMDENDHVAIAVYAGAAGMVLNSTPGNEKDKIMAAIDNLRAGGSTNGGAGIKLAYSLAEKNFVKEGVNRVILASDGDFNVGTTNQDELVKLIEKKRESGVFLSVLGFGSGNYKDSTMEKLANKGNGNYAYIDSIKEARKVLVEEGAGTLYTIAKDVKIQVEFNPAKVQAYRLIGYENRLLAKEDFNDDTKDAGEIGAGHTVTALYEVVPVGVKAPGVPPVDALKYQTPKPAEKPAVAQDGEVSNELLTVKLRYKQPDGDVSTRMDVPVVDAGKTWHDASQDYRFAAGVAQFGMLLRNSPYKGDSTYAQVLDLAQSGMGDDEKGYRSEFVKLVEKARALNAALEAKSE